MRIKYLVLLASITLCFAATTSWAQDPYFIRGDVTGDGVVDDADSTMMYAYVFQTIPPNCVLAADVDDDGVAGLNDFLYLYSYLYLSGDEPPAPFPDCGTDPTDPQPGDDCCTPPTPQGAVPSITPVGALVLVLLLVGSGIWVYRRQRLATTSH